jgi:hypothetical protein
MLPLDPCFPLPIKTPWHPPSPTEQPRPAARRAAQGAAYYCPFVSKRAAMDRALANARKEMEELVSDMVERTRR